MPGFTAYIIDTETTGTDPSRHEIIELAICRLSFDAQGEPQTESKTWYIRALSPDTIEEEALGINGHLREEILGLTPAGKEKYRLPTEVVPDVEVWIMQDGVSGLDRIFVGQNPTFDLNFMQALWRNQESLETFPFEVENHNRMLDTKQLAVIIDLCTGRRRIKYNLGSLIKAFGIKKGKLHRAEEDTRVTTELLLAFLTPLRPVVAEKFKDNYLSEDTI